MLRSSILFMNRLATNWSVGKHSWHSSRPVLWSSTTSLQSVFVTSYRTSSLNRLDLAVLKGTTHVSGCSAIINMELLYADMCAEVAQKLTLISLVNFLQTSKQMWKLRHRIHYFSKVDLLREICYLKRWESGLIHAVKMRDLELIHFFLQKGAANWNKAIKTAAEGGPSYILDFFLTNGPQKCSYWVAAIKGALKSGNMDLIFCLANKTPFYCDYPWIAKYAAASGNLQLTKMFLQGASLTSRKCVCNYMIEAAAKKGHIEIIRYLMGQDDNMAMEYIKYCYVWSGAFHPVTLKYIREELSKVHPPCEYCAWRGIFHAARKGNKQLVYELLPFNEYHYTMAMCGAAYGGKLELLQSLVEDARKLCKTDRFCSVLSCAAKGGHQQVVQFLLELPETRMNIVGAGSGNPLYEAARKGYRDIVEILLSVDYMTPFRHMGCRGAIRGNCMDIYHLCKAGISELNVNTALNEALWEAAQAGNEQLVEYYVEQGATRLTNAATTASQQQFFSIASFLVDKGADLKDITLGRSVDLLRLLSE